MKKTVYYYINKSIKFFITKNNIIFSDFQRFLIKLQYAMGIYF